MSKITTLDMEVALMKYFNPRQSLVVPNVSWGIWNESGGLHECDLLVLTGSDYATEVEIKVSKSDLIKDCEKRHGHSHPLIRRLYFAVPEELVNIALVGIPFNAGLLEVKHEWVREDRYRSKGRVVIDCVRTDVREVRPCIINGNAIKWNDEQRQQLARLGALRILGLKQRIQKLIHETK